MTPQIPSATLIFPDTAEPGSTYGPLFLAFSSVYRLLPAENNEKNRIFPEQMSKTLLTAPLGEDAERFHHLIHEIEKGQGDYRTQLKQLMLASLSQQESPTDSGSSIIASLREKASTPGNSKQNETLWRARLVLGMAEILDREEEEIAERIHLLDQKKQLLLANLKGETAASIDRMLDGEASGKPERLLNDAPVSPSSTSPISANMQKRLTAWKRLMLHKETPPLPSFQTWSTRHRDIFELLSENHRLRHDTAPELAGEITVPQRLGNSPEELKLLERFLQEIQKQNISAFHLLTTPGDCRMAIWTQLLDAHFDSREFGRERLQLYRFRTPVISCFDPSQQPAATETGATEAFPELLTFLVNQAS